jgi:hypothetical protein
VDAENDYDFAELFPIGELIDRLPPLPNGRKHATSKIYSWLNLSGTGRRTLKSIVVGRNRYTTEKWLRDFIDGGSTPSGMRTPAKRRASADRARRELETAGI